MQRIRGTETLCDLIDHATEVVTSYLQTVQAVIADGEISDTERHLLRVAEVEAVQAIRAPAGPASEADCAMVTIRAIAGAGRVSPHAYRKARESYRDGRRIQTA